MSERTGQFDPTRTPGTFGAPPEGSPREVTTPGSEAPTPEQVAMALRNEQVLPPFAPEKRMGVGPPTTLHAKPRELSAAHFPSHQPAASNTDSPSRGMPTPIADPGKQITGGWGPSLQAQYFPLDGMELRELARGLLDALNERLERDMHFTPAMTYPRFRMKLTLAIDGFASGFPELTLVEGTEYLKTSEAVAKELAGPVAVSLEEMKQEVAEDGTAEHPPDRVRDDLGLVKPHKHQVEMGGRKTWVDVEPDGLDNIF